MGIRENMIAQGPFTVHYLTRSRYEGYALWPEKNLADRIAWNIDESMAQLETEDYVIGVNEAVRKRELTIKRVIHNPDWKPMQFWLDNEPKPTSFDYWFSAEELELPLKERIKIAQKREKDKCGMMVARYIAHVVGRDMYSVLKELIKKKGELDDFNLTPTLIPKGEYRTPIWDD